jgi:hypothetical protein
VERLEHESHVLAAQLRRVVVVERGELDAVDEDLPRVRTVEARRLSRVDLPIPDSPITAT